LGPFVPIGFCCAFNKGLSAQVVLSSIPVLSEELRTPLKAVIFVLQAKPP
jgi:hypothetical protein